ncbi:uncharacterized protein MKK02DRAFT_37665 [Dioszegia hungarica]|uniref:Uncharacterized protein n=1 Tax=Dioszegia hungarica TaxID=4972 RepID=A0AA38H8E6_9TREE|nr:uncharacterized protein MKK02DRAFT_37665 [Dioszegia hungarica]KAI9634789.1 hypothetical protein MKK02DRAFT_37665 [Dioszegia hungarica]
MSTITTKLAEIGIPVSRKDWPSAAPCNELYRFNSRDSQQFETSMPPRARSMEYTTGRRFILGNRHSQPVPYVLSLISNLLVEQRDPDASSTDTVTAFPQITAYICEKRNDPRSESQTAAILADAAVSCFTDATYGSGYGQEPIIIPHTKQAMLDELHKLDKFAEAITLRARELDPRRVAGEEICYFDSANPDHWSDALSLFADFDTKVYHAHRFSFKDPTLTVGILDDHGKLRFTASIRHRPSPQIDVADSFVVDVSGGEPAVQEVIARLLDEENSKAVTTSAIQSVADFAADCAIEARLQSALASQPLGGRLLQAMPTAADLPAWNERSPYNIPFDLMPQGTQILTETLCTLLNRRWAANTALTTLSSPNANDLRWGVRKLVLAARAEEHGAAAHGTESMVGTADQAK